MKKEVDIMHAFSDERLRMDPRFKAKLGQRIGRYDRKLAKRSAGRSRAWFGLPKAVLAPALLFAVVAIGAVLLLNGANRGGLAPAPVSAAEVVARSQQYYATLDVSKYNFFAYQSTTVRGPKYACLAGRQLDVQEGTYAYYDYWSKLDATEASYVREDGGEAGTTERSYFTRNGTKLHETYNGTVQRDIWIYGLKVGDKPAFTITDKDGRAVPQADIRPVRQNGVDVYVVHARPNDPALQAFCEGEVYEYVFDARSFRPVIWRSYLGSVAPENMILDMRSQESFRSVSEQEALRIMTDAGFDKEYANPEPSPLHQ